MPLSTCFMKTFRYIELSNGLRALLISDLGQEACVCKSEKSHDDSDDNDKEDDSEEEDGEQDSDDDRDSNDSDENGEVMKKMKKVTSEKQVMNLN